MKLLKKILIKINSSHIKTRHKVSFILVASSFAFTPFAIKQAYIYRGYTAFGGEYMLLPFAMLISLLICDVSSCIEAVKNGGEK